MLVFWWTFVKIIHDYQFHIQMDKNKNLAILFTWVRWNGANFFINYLYLYQVLGKNDVERLIFVHL